MPDQSRTNVGQPWRQLGRVACAENKAGALGHLGHPCLARVPDKQADIPQSSEKAHAILCHPRMRSQQDRFLKRTTAGSKDLARFE